jgi:hypothetical protein
MFGSFLDSVTTTNTLLTIKRERSPSPSTSTHSSSPGQPLQKVIRKTFGDFTALKDSRACIVNSGIVNYVWPEKRPEDGDLSIGANLNSYRLNNGQLTQLSVELS